MYGQIGYLSRDDTWHRVKNKRFDATRPNHKGFCGVWIQTSTIVDGKPAGPGDHLCAKCERSASPKRNGLKRTRLKRTSPKRQLINRERAAFIRDFITTHPDCMACAKIGVDIPEHMRGWKWKPHRAEEVHEPLTRARAPGKETILDAANALAVCRWAHRWIHSHPAAAEARGLLVSSRGLS